MLDSRAAAEEGDTSEVSHILHDPHEEIIKAGDSPASHEWKIDYFAHAVASVSSRFTQEAGLMPQRICLSENRFEVSPMDRLHEDFFASLNQLSSASDHDFCGGFTALLSQVERAFRLEEQWMEDIGFPAFHVHQEQHARALGALHCAHARVMSGDLELGREVVEELLPRWCAFHMPTMDRPLDLAMQMARFQAVGSKESMPANNTGLKS